MTQEECIALLKRYAEYDGMGIPNLAGCREAMRMAVELLSKPSPPPNLDEVAGVIVARLVPTLGQKYEDGSYVRGTRDYFSRDDLIGLVKAGAEWMAGQGETFNGYISIKGKRSLIAIEGKSDICKFGDEVIVQIRKK